MFSPLARVRMSTARRSGELQGASVRTNNGAIDMLKGRTALVTGSTSGIGLGIAKVLAEQGANLVLNGYGEPEKAVAEVRALGGGRVVHHDADMSNVAEIEALIDFGAATFGSIDILVNN